MIRTLSTPHFGQTHVRFELFLNEPGRIFVRGSYGTLQLIPSEPTELDPAPLPVETFVPAVGLLPLERALTGAEYTQFFAANGAAYNALTDGLVAQLAL